MKEIIPSNKGEDNLPNEAEKESSDKVDEPVVIRKDVEDLRKEACLYRFSRKFVGLGMPGVYNLLRMDTKLNLKHPRERNAAKQLLNTADWLLSSDDEEDEAEEAETTSTSPCLVGSSSGNEGEVDAPQSDPPSSPTSLPVDEDVSGPSNDAEEGLSHEAVPTTPRAERMRSALTPSQSPSQPIENGSDDEEVSSVPNSAPHTSDPNLSLAPSPSREEAASNGGTDGEEVASTSNSIRSASRTRRYPDNRQEDSKRPCLGLTPAAL